MQLLYIQPAESCMRRGKKKSSQFLRTKNQSNDRLCVVRAMCSHYAAGKKLIITILRMKKESYDRFCTASARRCQVVFSPNVSPWLFATIRGLQGPEHARRTSTGARTCAVMYARVSCVPRGREHEKRPQAEKGQLGTYEYLILT